MFFFQFVCPLSLARKTFLSISGCRQIQLSERIEPLFRQLNWFLRWAQQKQNFSFVNNNDAFRSGVVIMLLMIRHLDPLTEFPMMILVIQLLYMLFVCCIRDERIECSVQMTSYYNHTFIRCQALILAEKLQATPIKATMIQSKVIRMTHIEKERNLNKSIYSFLLQIRRINIRLKWKFVIWPAI